MTEDRDLKLPYETPHLTVIGSFEDVTQASSVGTHLDATMPVGTPLSEVLQHLS